jgi:Pyruvate/2-oxoacid:ferredoxin oxidoreductase gamma subunit
MIPTFPLNVFRDRTVDMTTGNPPPIHSVPEVLEIVPAAKTAAAPKHAHHHHFKNFGIKVAGFGGQGVLLLGQLLTEMGMREGLDVSWLPSYGPEMRSGSAHCHVCLSKERVGSPLVAHPDVLIAMNEPSLRKFASQIAPGGAIIYNGEHLPANFDAPEARIICIPASEIADRLGSAKAANIVMLGALLEETECLACGTAMETIENKVKKVAMLEINRKALAAGRQYIDHEAHIGALSQPDGCGE